VQHEESAGSFCGRSVAYLKALLDRDDRALVLEPRDSFVFTDLGNGLLVSYVVDQGDRFQFVQYRHLDEAGLTEAELERIGVDNLRAILNGTGVAIRDQGEFFTLNVGGNFEASLILVDSLWEKHLVDYAPNGFVVAIPDRDRIGFCDARSRAGLEALRQFVLSESHGAHPMTSSLYVCDPATRGWRVLGH
jgi:uncharacterized protein YtpQ (UPF0354 family)